MAVDGSLYKYHPHFKNRMISAMKELEPSELSSVIYFIFIPCDLVLKWSTNFFYFTLFVQRSISAFVMRNNSIHDSLWYFITFPAIFASPGLQISSIDVLPFKK